MALPGEKEHLAYLDYVEETASRGDQPLSKEEWRKKVKNSDKQQINTVLNE